MKGYEITFYTQQDRLRGMTQMSEWLLTTAREMGLRGATIVTGSEGYGHDRHIHSARFFELADSPQKIVMVGNEEETNKLFDHLQKEGVYLFYVKTPVEFGTLGESDY